MSKIEAKKTSVIEDNLILFSFLDDVKDLFKLQAQKKDLTLVFKRSPDIPRYIRTDKVKLRQILTNLINNALKFTEKGSVIVHISKGKKAFSENEMDQKIITLNIEVQDTGPGIHPDEIEHIFEPFVQTHTGHGQKEGTGLGLSISRKFAQLMGGNIQVKSKPGSGSVFKLTLPVSPGNPELNSPGMGPDPQRHLRAIYDPKGEDKNSKIEIPAHQIQQAIANLPLELKNEFKNAVILVDFDRALTLLEEIQKENKALAQALAKLVRGYQFNILQTLFEEVN